MGFSSQEIFVSVLLGGHLAKMVAHNYHNKYHTDINSVVTHIRNDVWIFNIRKIVSSIDKRCKIERSKYFSKEFDTRYSTYVTNVGKKSFIAKCFNSIGSRKTSGFMYQFVHYIA